MSDYQPVDLTPWCNATPGAYEQETKFEPGLLMLRGARSPLAQIGFDRLKQTVVC